MALKYDGVNPVLWLNERISWIQALYGSPLANVPFGTNDFSSGTISATSSWPFYGYIAEVIVYSNQLSQAQIESVNNYLCKKYNRKNQSIVLDGPSTIAGVTTSAYGNPAGVLKQVFRDWDIDVVAYSGATTARTTNTEPYWMNVLKPNKNIYIFNVANNDFSGLTTAQATTQMPATETNYINAYVNARNAGYLTLAMTTLSTYSETNGYVTNFNNWLLNNWSGFADGIIDSHLDTNLCGTAGAYMNAAYFSNGGSTNTGLHWTSVLVTNLVNNYMAPAIKKLVGGFIQPLSSSCYVLTTNLTSTNLMTATPFYVTATNNGTYTLTAHFSAMGAATTNYPSLDIETTSVVPAGLQASYWYQEMNVLTNGYYNALKDQAYPAVVISSASHLCLTYAPNFNYQAATIDLAIKEVITNAPVTFYAYVVDYDGSGSLNLLQTNTVSATSWLQLSQP